LRKLYDESWALYKAQTESFVDDIGYYSQFVNNHHALELFAGYGRVANPLVKMGRSLETVEIQPAFAQFINLPPSRNHVCDVLEFHPAQKFTRIFAAYNSFCLFIEPAAITRFFHLLDQWLQPGGKISLSYYHPDHWPDAAAFEFDFGGEIVKYTPDFDLSKRKSEKIGTWIDQFIIKGKQIRHQYITKVYESAADLEPYLKFTNLNIVEIINNFNMDYISEPGWTDYILEKHA
jgi:hypothetical protein